MEYSQILKSCKSSPSKNYKADINLAKKLDRKGRKFPVKIRDIHKIKKENSRNQKEKSKQNSVLIGVFGYENEEKHPIYVAEKML